MFIESKRCPKEYINFCLKEFVVPPLGSITPTSNHYRGQYEMGISDEVLKRLYVSQRSHKLSEKSGKYGDAEDSSNNLRFASGKTSDTQDKKN